MIMQSCEKKGGVLEFDFPAFFIALKGGDNNLKIPLVEVFKGTRQVQTTTDLGDTMDPGDDRCDFEETMNPVDMACNMEETMDP